MNIEEIKYTRHNEKTGEDVEKTRFSLALTDGTGNVRTTYFPKKATVEKIRELKQGDGIVIIGSNELERGVATVKNMRSGEQMEVAFNDIVSALQ